MIVENVIIKLSLVFILSFIFGTQRQKSHKPVGFGTFIFVSVGACVITIIGSSFYQSNPVFLLGAILTGIGFLGAGALIRDNDRIFGFTTAASLWLFSILGITIGIGEYFIAGVTYFLIWIVILSDLYLEKHGVGSYRKKLIIETKKDIGEKKVREFLRDIGIKRTNLISLEINKISGKNLFIYFVEGSKNKIKQIPFYVSNNEWIESVSLK